MNESQFLIVADTATVYSLSSVVAEISRTEDQSGIFVTVTVDNLTPNSFTPVISYRTPGLWDLTEIIASKIGPRTFILEPVRNDGDYLEGFKDITDLGYMVMVRLFIDLPAMMDTA